MSCGTLLPLICHSPPARFDEYRASLVQHLHDFTLRHWDPAMRQIGAQALAAIHVQRQNSRELHASLDREVGLFGSRPCLSTDTPTGSSRSFVQSIRTAFTAQCWL